MIHEIQIKWELVIGICSIIIAVLALGLTIWQLTVTNRHNRLSFKPLLNFNIHPNMSTYSLPIILSNVGPGVAIINKQEIYFEGNKVDNQDFKNFMYEKLRNTGENFEVKISYHYVSEAGGDIASGDFKELLNLQFRKINKDLFSKFLVLLRKLEIHIKYNSVYNEKFGLLIKLE